MSEEAAAKPLTFEVVRNGDSSVVTCHGRLVAGTTDDFFFEVKRLIPLSREVLIDLAELSYVDSMGLGTLVRLYVSARGANCDLQLQHLGKQVRNLLTMTNLLSVFSHAESHNITVA